MAVQVAELAMSTPPLLTALASENTGPTAVRWFDASGVNFPTRPSGNTCEIAGTVRGILTLPPFDEIVIILDR
jgi:hypothetical protein